jgi:hypothetical protein
MISNPPDPKAEVAASDHEAKQFRRLKADELVSQGDFVADGRSGFKLWEGLSGFRADSFVKTIYRRLDRRTSGDRKLS